MEYVVDWVAVPVEVDWKRSLRYRVDNCNRQLIVRFGTTREGDSLT